MKPEGLLLFSQDTEPE